MSVTSQSSAIGGDGDDDGWVAEYCSWWVVVGPYSTRQSNVVHLPNAIRDEEPGDPHDDPPAETLCYTSNRKNSEWQTKSHAVMPINYRPICSKCTKALAEVVGDD